MPHKAKLLGWLRSDAAKVFSEYIGELKAGLEQRLLVNPKRFVTHKVLVAGENSSIEQAIGVQEDLSDLIRGQILAYNEILKFEAMLKADTIEKLQLLVKQIQKEEAEQQEGGDY